MGEPLECLKAQPLASRSSLRDAEPSKDEIARRQRGKRPEDYDRTEPGQYDLVKIFQLPSGGLDEDARALVGLVDLSFNGGRLSKQSLCSDGAPVRLDVRA